MTPPKYFRERLINYSKRYPRVYWPGHPCSDTGGIAAIHRIVGYDMWGEEVFGKDVHHKDGDPLNWLPENLELLTPREHSKLHNPLQLTYIEYFERRCGTCGKNFLIKTTRRGTKKNVFCSVSCARKGNYKIDWPPDEVLLAELKNSNFSALGRKLGVSDNAIRKRLKNRGFL